MATGGVPATGGTPPTGGTISTGGTTGAGCTGSFENIQAVEGQNLCVAKTVTFNCPSTEWYIDSTEVTNGQYQAWLDTSPSTLSQTAVCSWNSSFTPSSNWPPTSSDLAYPVVYVNWCDAYAYCAGVGKRLCGKIGGGSNGYSDYKITSLSQWYAACSSCGKSGVYPYGDTYQANYCNGYDYWNGNSSTMKTLPVGSLGSCQSLYLGGVYDLSGNVWEWEDSCKGTGAADGCRVRGGGFGDVGSKVACGFDYGLARSVVGSIDVGFRCCSP